MDFYGFNSAPTVRENHTVTGSHSGRRNITIPDQLSRFIGPSAFHQSSYHILRGYHDATASGLERLPVPFEDHLLLFHWTFLGAPTPSVPSPILALSRPSSRLPNCASSRHASYGSESLHRQDAGSLVHKGIIEFSPPVFFVFTLVAALTTVFSSLEYVFSFGF